MERDDQQLVSEREYSVVKDNKLIQNVSRRKFELSIMEQKVLGYILSKIKPLEADQPETGYVVRFEIQQFCRVCGIDADNGNNYRNVRNALDKLSDNAFWLDYGSGEFKFYWITAPDIQRGKGLIEVEIPRKTMPFLRGLSEKFVSYQLYNILALKGSYSIMLYELFKSYAFQKQLIVPIDRLKRYLCITPDKYQNWKDFRKAVLDRSLREINKVTDIRVDYTPIRKGRYYELIAFDITVLKGIDSWEAYNRAMAEINGIKYVPGQMHIFDDLLNPDIHY